MSELCLPRVSHTVSNEVTSKINDYWIAKGKGSCCGTAVVKLDSRDTPPPLHFSPIASDRERTSTADTTPISTPRAFATGLPRKGEKENLLSWQHKHSGFAGATSAYVDSTLLDSDFEDSTFPLFNEPSRSLAMGTRSGPTTSPHTSSQPSNLTSALQTTSGNSMKWGSAMEVDGDKSSDTGVGEKKASEHLGTAAQPISVQSSNRGQPTGDNLATSMVTGMSWGGQSVGSWIRDDMIMQGTSPFAHTSPSFHSASYMPRLEANFMKDFNCCNRVLPTMHDLLQHYEEDHTTYPHQPSPNPQPSQPPSARAAYAAVAAKGIQNQETNQARPPPINTSRQGHITQQTASTPVTPRQSQPAQHVQRGFDPAPPQPSQLQDDEPAGDMEMDEDYTSVGANLQQPQYSLNPSKVPPPALDMSNTNRFFQQQHQGLRNSQPTSPVSAGRNGNMYHNNPTVSSVNTPTLNTYTNAHPLQNQFYTPQSSAPGTPRGFDDNLPDAMGNMHMSNTVNPQYMHGAAYDYSSGNGNPMLDYCIDNPATTLRTRGGGLPVDHVQTHQSAMPASSSQLGDDQYSENSQLAKNIREAQKEAGVLDPSADGGPPKPFHCPVIGCEKAYKNQNGLKYHKQVSIVFVFHGSNK
ncbi:Transcriptional regulator of ribosomal biogenesis proteins [Lecanora helva]